MSDPLEGSPEFELDLQAHDDPNVRYNPAECSTQFSYVNSNAECDNREHEMRRDYQ